MFERQHLTIHCLFSKPLKYWLVVSNKCYCPFHIWDVILITHWLSYFSEGWVYHQPEYDINFAESWALRVERVRTGSEMRHLLDESSIFHGFLMVTWKNSHGCGKKKHHKSRSCSLGFLKFHGNFHGFSASSSEKSPYFSVNSHVCHRFYWASNVSPVSRKKSWPQPTCALCSVEPESPAGGRLVDWCSNKMRQFPYEKGGFAHQNGWNQPWFTMIYHDFPIQIHPNGGNQLWFTQQNCFLYSKQWGIMWISAWKMMIFPTNM